jgi:hypothetical protein
MSTEDALAQYNAIAGRVFSTSNKKLFGQDGTFKATTLENEMKRVVADNKNAKGNPDEPNSKGAKGNPDERMLDDDSSGLKGAA